MEDLGVHGGRLCKIDPKVTDRKMFRGFIWLRKGISGGVL